MRTEERHGEYHLSPEARETRYVLDRMDQIQHKTETQIDELRKEVIAVKVIVSNGLSHRTEKTEKNVEYLQEHMVTKADLEKMISKRDNNDEAWTRYRRQVRITWLLVIGSAVASGIVGMILSNVGAERQATSGSG